MPQSTIGPIKPYDLPTNKALDSYLLHPEWNWQRYTGMSLRTAMVIAENKANQLLKAIEMADMKKRKGCQPCIFCENYAILRRAEAEDQAEQMEEIKRGITWWERYRDVERLKSMNEEMVHPPKLTFNVDEIFKWQERCRTFEPWWEEGMENQRKRRSNQRYHGPFPRMHASAVSRV